MKTNLRVGIAIFNVGEHHAAHDAWEDQWLQLEDGDLDERFFHGLIQYSAVIYHAHNRNWEGTIGLAESAISYLESLPNQYRGVDLDPIREVLRSIGSDPEWIERSAVPPIRVDGAPIAIEDLSIGEAAVAAQILAEEHGFDRSILSEAGRFARHDVESGNETSPFVTMLYDFLDPDRNRSVVFRRLDQHVDRRTDRESDVDGLFED